MTGDDLAENYRLFARLEARGRSPHYEALATAVAGDRPILEFLLSLPPDKRQPNLLFAAARYLLGAVADLGSLRMLIGGRRPDLADLMLARRTQTNEPARCAVLLPALALLPQPLALLEVGASAGLTLLPDRYSYDYAGHRISGTDPGAPVLACDPRGAVPLPERVPEVAWRAGLDLNPLDVTDADDVRWLECLVWPSTVVTCSPACPTWPGKHPRTRPWSFTTRRCSATWPSRTGGSSPTRSAGSVPPGSPTRAPGCCPG
jgi:uncharacterized protein DUF2332